MTESALVEGDLAIPTLRKLGALGIAVAIDDFGTGHSSLGGLRRLPIDYLKLDRSLVAAMTEGGDDTVFVSALLGLAHTLHLRTITEGVETEEQLALLGSGGCELGQGYLWSGDLSVSEATSLVRRGTPLKRPTGETSLGAGEGRPARPEERRARQFLRRPAGGPFPARLTPVEPTERRITDPERPSRGCL